MRRELIEYTCDIKDCTNKLTLSRSKDKAPLTEGWEEFPEDANADSHRVRYACPSHSGPIRAYNAAVTAWSACSDKFTEPLVLELRQKRVNWQVQNPPPAHPVMIETDNGWIFAPTASDSLVLCAVATTDTTQEPEELCEPGDVYAGDT